MSRRVQVMVGDRWTDWFAIWIPERATNYERGFVVTEPTGYALGYDPQTMLGTAHWIAEGAKGKLLVPVMVTPPIIRLTQPEPRPYEVSRDNGVTWTGPHSLADINQMVDELVAAARAETSETKADDGGPWLAIGIAAVAALMFFGSTRGAKRGRKP